MPGSGLCSDERESKVCEYFHYEVLSEASTLFVNGE